MKAEYDLIFGFGQACSCSQTLRRAGLQLLSFPFDWLGCVRLDDDMRRRTDLVAQEFRDWLRLEDFVLEGENTNGMYRCINTRHGLSFIHDFPIGVPMQRSFQSVAAKYRRRTDRLMSLVRKSNKVLIVRLDRPDIDWRTTIEECRHTRKALAEAFAPTKFDLLLMQPDPKVPFGSQRLEVLEPGIFRLGFDYRNVRPSENAAYLDLRLTAAAVTEHFAVRDYRTKAEIAAHRLKERKKRWAKYGATSAWQYRWRRLVVGNPFFHLAKNVAARLRQRRIEQIIPMGTNCEIAFRFYRRWGFVDSSLFAWAQTFNLDTISAVLGELGVLPTGDFRFGEKANMWHHLATGTYFHGKMQHKPGANPPSAAEQSADLADLRGRLRHLIEKLYRYAANDKETLFIHKLSDNDAMSSDLSAKLDRFEAAIASLGARNWRLLVVCRKCDMKRMPPPSSRRLYRSVKAFNPGNKVTCEKMGDPDGWNAIFTEFAPARVLPKSHSFKFE